MAGVRGNRPKKQAVKLHRNRTEVAPPKAFYRNKGEAEVVPGYQLSEVLKAWTVKWLKDHPHSHHDPQFKGDTRVAHMGPVQYLAYHSGINTRRVSGICNNEFLHVSLSQADALLTAAG